jgi:hypothetical protein
VGNKFVTAEWTLDDASREMADKDSFILMTLPFISRKDQSQKIIF